MDIKKINIDKIKEIFLDKHKVNYFILALIVAAYLFVLLTPEIKVLFQKLSEGNRLKARIVEIKKDWANIDTFKKRIAELHEQIDYYEKKLPGEKEIPAVLGYLSEAAKEMNVRITEIEPGKVDKDEIAPSSLYYKEPILLNAECGYHQLGRFLSKLESADRFMKISDIKIIADPRNANIHYVRISVLTYVMKR